MGYSKSLRAVNRVRAQLNAMLTSETNIEFPSDNPSQLGFWIRDGLSAAITRGETQYAELRGKFQIRLKRNAVLAELRVPPIEMLRDMTIPGVSSTLEIIGAVLHQRLPMMHFPDARNVDLPALFAWTSKRGYFIVSTDFGLTLTKDDPG